MTQEEKQLLMTDLSARLPYGIMITMGGRPPMRLEYIHNDWDFGDAYCMCSGFEYEIEECKPYLRSMSSMTEEEEIFYNIKYPYIKNYEQLDWLNAHHFDYRGLIEKGLVLEAPESMYKEV